MKEGKPLVSAARVLARRRGRYGPHTLAYVMSLRAVHAGTGYQYLLRSVATHDADPQGMALSDYYAAKGTPPGRWIGSGLQGLNSQSVASGSTVTEAQMAALYGEGLHPDTDQMMADGQSLSACKLGRSFPIYTGGVDVLEAISAAEKTFLAVEGRRPTADERGQIAEGAARPYYAEKFGYEHASGKDVIAWVNRERDQVRQAVAGFDFTFSPVKSVSVLWALADEQTASQVAALHHEAVAEALAWAEDNAIYTRVGTGGIKQVTTGGIIASEFTHFDTRCGDPDLHSHVLVANKVQGPDGRWLSLDSRAIHQMHQAISARYDAILHDLLTRRMGVEFQANYPHPDKAPIWEIAGIDRRLIDAFSSRRALARP
ncbi:MAG: MobF family relaxase, partial [Dietzia cercidiphylli]